MPLGQGALIKTAYRLRKAVRPSDNGSTLVSMVGCISMASIGMVRTMQFASLASNVCAERGCLMKSPTLPIKTECCKTLASAQASSMKGPPMFLLLVGHTLPIVSIQAPN